MLEITDEAARALRRKGKRIAPEVPLESDDGETGHADPDHGQGGFPSRQTGI